MRFNTPYVPYLALALLVLVVKVVQVGVDATPLLFLGDSETYVYSAVEGFMPICRSFVYGWPIRWWGLATGSIMGLVIAQVVAGGITAWLVGAVLLYFYRVRFGVATALTLAFAFDPLQLLHERLVMAETFSLLIFALLVVLALSYLRQPRVLTLAGVCGLGLVLVSLRIMFVPVVLAAAVLLPVVGWVSQPAELRRARWGRALAHLGMAVALTAVLHGAYRGHVGKVFRQPPAYQYYDGLMLMAAWAPILQPEDAPDSRVAELLKRQADDPVYPLTNRYIREMQLWEASGLAGRLQAIYGGDIPAANACAKKICRAALVRRPGAVVDLAWQALVDYAFRWDRFRFRLWIEQGSDRFPDPAFVTLLRDRLAWDAANVHAVRTPSKRYHLIAGPWYVFLFFSPVLWLVPMVRGSPFQRSAGFLLFTLTVLLVVVLCVTSPVAVYRYLHPLSFTALLALGTMEKKRRGRVLTFDI